MAALSGEVFTAQSHKAGLHRTGCPVYRVPAGSPQPTDFQKQSPWVFGRLDLVGFELVGELEELV